MNINDVWKLFEKTGKIQYYMMYNKMRREKSDTIGDQDN